MPFSFLCLLALPAISDTNRDPGLRTPYDLEVVVRVAPHRLMTAEFQSQIERQLRDSLHEDLAGDAAVMRLLGRLQK
jgi:hypothetical protein